MKKQRKKPNLLEIHRVRCTLLRMALRLMKLTLPPGFENSTTELRSQLLVTANILKDAADALEAEGMAWPTIHSRQR